MRKAAFSEWTAAAAGPKAAFTECTSAAPNPPDVYEARASISGIATRRCLARVEVRAAKLVSRGWPTVDDRTALPHQTPARRIRSRCLPCFAWGRTFPDCGLLFSRERSCPMRSAEGPTAGSAVRPTEGVGRPHSREPKAETTGSRYCAAVWLSATLRNCAAPRRAVFVPLRARAIAR